MKPLLRQLTLPLISSFALSSASGVTLLVENFTPSNTEFLAVADPAGNAIPNRTGFVATGSFGSLDDATIVGGLDSPASISAILQMFRQFGNGSTFGGLGAFESPGLYRFSSSAAVTPMDAFDGRPVYTVATSSPDLTAPADLFIYKHPFSFAPDAPFFAETATTATGAGQILVGTPTTVTTLAGEVAGVRAITTFLDQIPEPSTVAMVGLPLVIFAMRRRPG